MGDAVAVGSLSASMLDRLLDDDPRAGTPFLHKDDLKKPSVLASRLRDRTDLLSQYLFDHFLVETQQELTRYESANQASDDLQHLIVVGLNEVIRRGCIFEPERF